MAFIATELSIRSMQKRSFVALLICGTSSAFAQVANAPLATPGPSFDCTKARGRIEKLVCADDELAASDRRVAELYAIALARSSDSGDAKRAQRRWLSERDGCEDRACAVEHYAERIAALGTQTGRFDRKSVSALCESVVDRDTRARLLEVTAGTEDINNDGRADRSSTCSGGTANIPCVQYLDENDRPLAIAPDGFEWMAYSALGRAPFRSGNRTFIYYSRDDAHEQPAFVSYITPMNREVRICDFDTTVASAVLEGSEEVCAAVESSDSSIEPVELAALTDGAVNATERRDTRPRAMTHSDIDNDGLEEHLIEYAYSSGAGRGCEINYFELLADDGRTVASNSNALAIRALQGLGNEGATERNCGLVSNRLFRFADKIYFEANVTNAPGTPHEVRILRGDATATICTFEREIRSRVKTLF